MFNSRCPHDHLQPYFICNALTTRSLHEKKIILLTCKMSLNLRPIFNSKSSFQLQHPLTPLPFYKTIDFFGSNHVKLILFKSPFTFPKLAIMKITPLWWRQICVRQLFRWFSRLAPSHDSSISRGRRKAHSAPENATLFSSLWTSWHLHSRIFARTRWGEDVKIFLLPLRQPLWTLCDFTSSHLCLDILLWKVNSLVLTFYVQWSCTGCACLWRLQEEGLLYL